MICLRCEKDIGTPLTCPVCNAVAVSPIDIARQLNKATTRLEVREE